MEPFDVLNMGNISDFHLEHSNCYLFNVFKFRDPYISPKKNSSDYGVYGIQNDWLEPLLQEIVMVEAAEDVPDRISCFYTDVPVQI